MAQRFGGKYSPSGAGSDPRTSPPQPPNLFDGKRPASGGARLNLLFLLALLPAIKGLTGNPAGLAFGIGGTVLLLGGSWLTREGLQAQAAYDLRKVAKRPAFPRKIFGAVLTGAGIALAGMASFGQPLTAALLGLLGSGLHLMSFGLDPLRDKGAEGVDDFQADRVARAVDEAEAHLAAMRDAILRARDRSLEARVDRFAAAARALFRRVESDPRDLTAARKYLSVYLMGARDATIKFADLYGQTRDARARADYETLLTDLETTFADRSQALLSNDSAALDVEIQVLRDRLQFETAPSKPD
ncbi:5-bromo-4-chloroindolyl phosphate hydrolysis family protein [Gemmobacter denitrificans]|uniref:5-bromo-4-chloroindolyl phosphate hydrolysis family protein n=1 Tax=Gemmobacter denitrificans TaxID=3123040 RepID=A0ABU8BUW5_9RHOB